MKTELQRIAIAEACGAKWIDAYWFGSTIKVLSFEPVPQLGPSRWDTEDESKKLNSDIPDYLNDLNAMHGAVLTLSPDNQFVWQHKVMNLTNDKGPKCGPFANANAATRAEAFIRTLNLWTA